MDKIKAAAKNICTLLREEIEPWAITGGCNLFLRGCTIQVGDIDIITSRYGSENIAKRLSGEKISIIKSKLDNVRSYYYATEIQGVTVEVMGDPENKVEGVWVKNMVWPMLIETVEIDNVSFPLESLDYELYIQSLLGNQDKTEQIRKYITKTST